MGEALAIYLPPVAVILIALIGYGIVVWPAPWTRKQNRSAPPTSNRGEAS